jgi:hypothetical protein
MENNKKFHTFYQQYPIQRLDIRENTESTTRKDDWVNWGQGGMNDYPQFVLELKEMSPTLSVCIDAKSNMSLGDGVEIEGLGNVMVNKFESLTELYYKLIMDAWLFGGWAVETIWNRERTAIESIYHLPFQYVRAEKKEEDDHMRDIEWFYYCEDWHTNKRDKKITKFHTLDPMIKDARQIYYWTNYQPSNNKIYPVLPWQSSTDAVALEAEIWAFHKRNLASSLLPNLHISLIGDPTPTEKEEIYAELINSYQGKDGAKLMVSFSDSPEERPVIETISNDANSSIYLDVLTLVQQNILTSNQISSPLLLGVQVGLSNGFSSNADEIKVSQNHMIQFVIEPFVKKMNIGLENVLSLKYNQPTKIINKFKLFNIE